jgi:arylsulfatase
MSDETKKKNKSEPHRSRNGHGRLLGTLFAGALMATSLSPLSRSLVHAQQPATAKPNILVIFGDDIGQSNISAYTRGLVGYKTPNIDRIANEGMLFTDYYAENSCTAGRSTFITGQVCLRTGLCKVGIPGAAVGLQDRDVSIAQAL